MSKKLLTILTASASVFTFTASTTLADWNVGDPAKFVQMPDLNPSGMDVNATLETNPLGLPVIPVLADDFLCTSTDPITDIHLWGSWLNDLLPQVLDPATGQLVNDPGSVKFNLSIFADVPTPNPAGFSMPGQLLWSRLFNPGEFAARPWKTNIEEGWLDPISNQFVFPGDTVAWQYNFQIPQADAFIQRGTSTLPVVYWLTVAASPVNDNQVIAQPLFGWKTSVDHFNDQAVVTPLNINSPNAPQWSPIEVPGVTQPLDMAFVITPEPASLALILIGGMAMLRRR